MLSDGIGFHLTADKVESCDENRSVISLLARFHLVADTFCSVKPSVEFNLLFWLAGFPIVADNFCSVGDPDVFIEYEQFKISFGGTDTVLGVFLDRGNANGVFAFGSFVLHPFYGDGSFLADFLFVHYVIQPDLLLGLDIVSGEFVAMDEDDLVVGTERAFAGCGGFVFKSDREGGFGSRTKPCIPNPYADQRHDQQRGEFGDERDLVPFSQLSNIALSGVGRDFDVIGFSLFAAMHGADVAEELHAHLANGFLAYATFFRDALFGMLRAKSRVHDIRHGSTCGGCSGVMKSHGSSGDGWWRDGRRD